MAIGNLHYTWLLKKEPVVTNYLTFTANTAGSTIGVIKYGSPTTGTDWWYSLNEGVSWIQYTPATEASQVMITLTNAGDKILWKGNNSSGLSSGYSKYYKFCMTGSLAASGSVMSLIDGIGESLVIPNSYCFGHLFANCTSLTTAPVLPATTLADGCYYNMFYKCTGLTTAPALPATTLAANCYSNMFLNCTSLATAPALPATTLAYYCYSSMFSGCTSLTTAPALPATTLADSCYDSMFSSCTSLTTAPVLPVTTLADSCYDSMFHGCTSLTTAPALPATTLADSCYDSMFSSCTSLTTAPVLPVTTLAVACYMNMFWDCTSLTTAPALPATTLADSCYYSMFDGCKSLTIAPALPATTLADSCYGHMFQGCKSLTIAPALPATTLAYYCYDSMFSSCINLTAAPALPATTLADYCYYSMFYDCTSIKLSETQTGEYQTPYRIPTSGTGTAGTDSLTDMFVDTGGTWTGTPNINQTYYTSNEVTPSRALTFTNTGLTTATIIIAKEGSPVGSDFKYSLDGGASWTQYSIGSAVAVTAGSSVMWKGNNSSGLSSTGDDYYQFTMAGGAFAASGSVMSLIDGSGTSTTIPNDYCFWYLFNGCSALTSAPELPATTLTEYCYSRMFQGCSNLTVAPELPATVMDDYCYMGMFYGCTSLATVPSLPATTLADSCYEYMFHSCTSLNTLPALGVTSLNRYCYEAMFYNCSGIKLSTTQTGEYVNEYRIPTTGTGSAGSGSLTDMFKNTGGSFTGTPSINTTYYTSNTIIT